MQRQEDMIQALKPLWTEQVPVSVYKNLIEAVHDNMLYMYDYVALRKKLLGVDELHFYDLYTPVVPDADMKITFEEAKETVLKALAPMGEDYLAILKEGFENRWIDVYENEAKQAEHIPQVQEFTLMCYSIIRIHLTVCLRWRTKWVMLYTRICQIKISRWYIQITLSLWQRLLQLATKPFLCSIC